MVGVVLYLYRNLISEICILKVLVLIVLLVSAATTQSPTTDPDGELAKRQQLQSSYHAKDVQMQGRTVVGQNMLERQGWERCRSIT